MRRIELIDTRRLTEREQHRSYHGNVIGIVGKTANRNVFSALPLDPASGFSLRQLSHPCRHFLFGCLTSPMQSLTASYNSPLNNLRVGGSKEDGPPNYSISSIDHSIPPIHKRANSPAGPPGSARRAMRKISPYEPRIRAKIRAGRSVSSIRTERTKERGRLSRLRDGNSRRLLGPISSAPGTYASAQGTGGSTGRWHEPRERF